MIDVHFVDASAALVKSARASVIAASDLVGGHRLSPFAGPNPPPPAADGAIAEAVLIAVPAGVELPGVTGPGLYRVEGLGADEAEHELFAAPGESGG